MPTNYLFQPNINVLETAHTNFFSSIRKTAYQPLVRAKNNKKHVFGHAIILSFVFLSVIYFYILYSRYVYIYHVFYILLRATQPNKS